MERENTCCFTGHRDIPLYEWDEVRAKLRHTIALLREKGVTNFVTGGAVGFDTIAAQEVLRLKGFDPSVTLTVVSPYKGQSDSFLSDQKIAFEAIKNASDDFIVLRQNYQKGCMMERNRYMADLSSYCIAYMKREVSGTGNTVRYALKNHLKVINLYVPEDEEEERQVSFL